jgi:hypothetical protein
MKPGEAYALRMRLAEAGHVPLPCRDGKPVLLLHNAPTEGAIRSWAINHSEADQTGIWNPQFGDVMIMDRVPETPGEVAARQKAQRLAEREAARRSGQERERAANQRRKETRRRAAGAIPRAEWLANHSERPWARSGMSKSAWYRARKRDGKGAADSG